MSSATPWWGSDEYTTSSTMKMSFRLILKSVAVVVLMAQAGQLRAQQSAPLFTERFANVFDPNSRTYFTVQGTEGKQFGGQQPFASIGATHYTGSIDSAVTLYSGQFMMNYNAITGNPAGSLGIQQRWMTDLPVLDRSIVGAGLYLDFTQSRYNNLFQQLDVNFELFTQSNWVGRANLYLPVGQIQQGTGIGGGASGLTVVNTVVGTSTSYQLLDVAMMGSDFELGRKFFNYRAEVYGSYYNWNGPVAGFTNGVRGGVRAYLTNNLSANVNISHDQFFGTNVYSGLTYFFGGNGGSRPMSFENLMTLPAQRSQQVAIGNYSRGTYSFTPLHDTASGDLLHAYVVKEGGTGTGTQADPASIASVLANTQFGHGSAMILVDAGGNFTTPIALTQDRQQIIGGGSTGTANIDFSVARGLAPGSSFLHLAGLGGRPVLAPTAGNAVTLTNQNTVQGFSIDGSGGLTNGISGNLGALDTTIRDMVIQNVAGTGIIIQPSTNTTIDKITFTNNGVDVLLDAANSKITNITSTGAVNGSLNIGGAAGDITGTTTIANVNIQNAGGFGGIQLNNAQNGAKINLTNVIVNGGTGSGITVNNSQTGSIYTLTNVDILTVGGTGMSLVNSNGTFNVDATSLINNAGSTGLEVNGGAIDVNYGGGLGQTVSDQSAVLVTGNHTGTLIFTNTSSINTTIGNGLQFDAADGTYKFLGTTTMNGGDAGIDIFNSNGDFTFTNPYINNTASGMGVKIVGGGGDAPTSTFNGLNITTISNQGFFVSNGGLTTVSGTANVTTSFGTAVELNGTPLAATFTNITSTHSPGAGISIDKSSGTFGVTGVATITGAVGSGLIINNSSTLTSTIQSVTIDTVGTASTDNGITLTDAGTVSILGGTINNSTGDGIHSSDTNLTATGLNIGGTGTITGDGIEIVNNGSAHTVNISNNTIKANASGISTKDSGNAKELLLTLDGNTIQAVNNGALAMDIVGNGTNSTIIKSMLNGTVIGGAGGGIEFKRVTFDASGTALTGTQVNAGNWTIGTTAARVQSDVLRFDGPTGDLKFGTLNIANNNGTGLYVDTKTLGTTFALTNTAGVIDTTNGSASFLDPLTLNMTFSSITSTSSPTNGLTLDGAAGAFTVTGLTSINGATVYGLSILNSSATVNFNNVTINTAGTNWINEVGNSGAVNFNGTVTVDGVVVP
jgi:hypothetical protein